MYVLLSFHTCITFFSNSSFTKFSSEGDKATPFADSSFSCNSLELGCAILTRCCDICGHDRTSEPGSADVTLHLTHRCHWDLSHCSHKREMQRNIEYVCVGKRRVNNKHPLKVSTLRLWQFTNPWTGL